MNNRMSRDELREKANKILQERYLICDTKGHQMLDEQTKMCNYCDRHLMQTESQKINDKINGLRKILDKLR